MRRLVTVGYEKSTPEDFIAALKTAGVTTLLDVREIPISRRRGFSKTGLGAALVEAGIIYRHERLLGSPKVIRHELRADGDYNKYFAAFKKYLRTQEVLLKSIATEFTGTVALMCFERDPLTCHRSVIARHLENLTGLTTEHIEVANGGDSKGARAHSGEGLSAA